MYNTKFRGERIGGKHNRKLFRVQPGENEPNALAMHRMVSHEHDNSRAQSHVTPALLFFPVVSMALTPVTEEEVAGVMRSLRVSKSTDLNGVSTWLFKQCYMPLPKPLTIIINTYFQEGMFATYRPAVMLDEMVLVEVDCTKLLGIHLNRELPFRNHAASVCA
ncbi:hypothetical protein J6590_067433 [Homalodisca vitripennis]|nr:hypothetical protein J6590_067433 [Homalodisca vitripennis]